MVFFLFNYIHFLFRFHAHWQYSQPTWTAKSRGSTLVWTQWKRQNFIWWTSSNSSRFLWLQSSFFVVGVLSFFFVCVGVLSMLQVYQLTYLLFLSILFLLRSDYSLHLSNLSVAAIERLVSGCVFDRNQPVCSWCARGFRSAYFVLCFHQ